MNQAKQALAIAARKGLVRSRDLSSRGVSRVTLSRLERKGRLIRIARGLYALPDHEATAFHSMVVAAARVPRAVLCLLSALRFHDLTTQQPPEVWIAIDIKARKPTLEATSLHVVRFSERMRRIGVEERVAEGVKIKVTSAARTVVDCFRYRNKIGLDVALEALRDYRRKYPRRMDEVWSLARKLRALRVLRPYLEATA